MTLRRRPSIEEGLVAVAMAGAALGVCLPVLQSGDRWGFWDWDIFEAAVEVARRSVVTYGQLPGWNPYVKGGESLVPHPLLPLASPFFPLVLALGTLPAIKVWIVLRQFLALWGAYWLGRRLGFRRTGAVGVAIVFGLSSCYAQRVAHGHWNLQAFVYLPLLMAAGLEAIRPRAWRARGLAALVLALMLVDGGPYAFAGGFLGLGALAVVGLLRRQGGSAALALGTVAALAFGLASVKAIPMLATYGGGERTTPYGPGRVLDFYHRTFRPPAGAFLYAALLDREQANRPGRFATFHLNVGAYLGPLGLGLVGLGAVCGGAVGRVALLLSLPVLWLCLGASAPLNLWALAHRLPIVNSMWVPAKFTPCYLLGLAVAAGAGVDGLERRFLGSKRARWALRGLLVALAVDLVVVARPLFAHAFPVEPIRVWPGSYHQRLTSPFLAGYLQRLTPGLGRRPFVRLPVVSSTADFPAVLANLGVLNTNSGAGPVSPVRAQPDESERLGVEQVSEVAGAEPRLISWSPNELRIALDPSRGGRVVVNQNHHPGWQAQAGDERLAVAAHEGLLAAELRPGMQEVTFRWRSPQRAVGAGLSLACLVASLALVLRRPREAGRDAEPSRGIGPQGVLPG